MKCWSRLTGLSVFIISLMTVISGVSADQSRPTANDAELKYWLANMAAHRFSAAEVGEVLGMSVSEARTLLHENVNDFAKLLPPQKEGDLRILPYPGGRHPRIGFLDGAVEPQRETKISIFPPWENGGYIVVDFPEAVWHQVDGKPQLFYLAHTHLDTIWDQQQIKLPALEWDRSTPGRLSLTRRFPNGVEMISVAQVVKGGVRFQFSIKNGTSQKLTGLRIQMCGMLKALKGFEELGNGNKIFLHPFAATRNTSDDHWVILGFDHCIRAWGNFACPCMHSDPQVPDCEPGETQSVHGWLSFFEGRQVMEEFIRLEKIAFEPISEERTSN